MAARLAGPGFPLSQATVPTSISSQTAAESNTSLRVAASIIRNEGVGALWTGLPTTLLMAVPATMLYFTAYEELRILIETRSHGTHASIAPLLAGGVSRTIAATVVAPLELFRTQLQAARGKDASDVILKDLIKDARSGIRGFSSLWRGLAPTLLRDVPFSMLYWFGYENLKKRMDVSCAQSQSEYILKSFASGLVSGSISAAITTPFDVIKTRVQVDRYSTEPSGRSASQIAQSIFRSEGWRGLFIGIVPRIGRIAPSCAIMISSYELGKQYFARPDPSVI